MFLVWGELMLMIGRLPTFGIYVQMFTTVAKNFAKFLAAYFCLLVRRLFCRILFACDIQNKKSEIKRQIEWHEIGDVPLMFQVAFALSFCVLFPNYLSFNVSPPAAIVKTLVMMAGEIEYENFVYENGDALFSFTGETNFRLSK